MVCSGLPTNKNRTVRQGVTLDLFRRVWNWIEAHTVFYSMSGDCDRVMMVYGRRAHDESLYAFEGSLREHTESTKKSSL